MILLHGSVSSRFCYGTGECAAKRSERLSGGRASQGRLRLSPSPLARTARGNPPLVKDAYLVGRHHCRQPVTGEDSTTAFDWPPEALECPASINGTNEPVGS